MMRTASDITSGEGGPVLVLPARYRRHHIWWLLLLPVLSLFAVLVNPGFKETIEGILPETMPQTSTYNKRASGYEGLFELAQKMHLDVRRFQRPYRDLPEEPATLVMIAPWELPSPNEAEAIERWVARGHDLILLDDFSNSDELMSASDRTLMYSFKLNAQQVAPQREVEASIDAGYPESALVQALKVSYASRIQGGNEVARHGKTVFLSTVQHGEGRCLVGSAPALCANQYLSEQSCKGDFQFLINWLSTSRQPVYFDEKCHGYLAASDALFFLLRSAAGKVIMQLSLITVVAFFSFNQRFGLPFPVERARKISNLEFIDGLATAYLQAQARDTVLSVLFGQCKAKLCRSLSIAPEEPVENLAKAWAQASGGNEGRCAQFLRDAQSALGKKRLAQAELSRLIALCDEHSDWQKGQAVPTAPIAT